MKTKTIITVFCLVFMITSCTKSPETIFDEDASGVVLILNKFYYTANIPGRSTMYFTGIDADTLSDLTFSQKEIKYNTVFGTGFFVSKYGKIATNRHVASPPISPAEVKACFNSQISNFKAEISNQQAYLSAQYSSLYSQLEQNESSYTSDENSYSTDDSYSSGDTSSGYEDNGNNEQLKIQLQELRDQYDQLESLKSNLSTTDVNDMKVSCVPDVKIAYNNTFVSKESDFKECVVTNTSDDDDFDLAIIQLKDKKTPESSHVFEISTKEGDGLLNKFSLYDPNKRVKLNDKLIMIGYNAGIDLAQTSQGIKAQLTIGNVSQAPDMYKILYSIPALAGSSGSPVLDEGGNVVAVNFAGVRNTQSFNFGIPVKALRKLIEDKDE